MARGAPNIDEFVLTLLHMQELFDLDVGPDTAAEWREARGIEDDPYFRHMSFQAEFLETQLEKIPEKYRKETIMGSLAAAFQVGFEMALLRYGADRA